MDYQLLYTYTNYDGDVISVEGDFITAYCGDTGNQLVAVLTPVGDKGVALARAILTSAGNTGHFVTSVETVVDSSRVSVEYGARSMRERIADAMEVEYGLLAARMVEKPCRCSPATPTMTAPPCTRHRRNSPRKSNDSPTNVTACVPRGSPHAMAAPRPVNSSKMPAGMSASSRRNALTCVKRCATHLTRRSVLPARCPHSLNG